VATQDCHKVTNTGIYDRLPIYALRLPSDQSKTPQHNYTVFEFIPKKPTNCGVGGYSQIGPCSYGNGTTAMPYNEFDDELSTVLGGLQNNTQYFLYGTPNQRLYGVKQIFRTLPNGSLQPKAGYNQVKSVPYQDPLIDGQPDPWLAPWDGTSASCNSENSILFPN